MSIPLEHGRIPQEVIVFSLFSSKSAGNLGEYSLSSKSELADHRLFVILGFPKEFKDRITVLELFSTCLISHMQEAFRYQMICELPVFCKKIKNTSWELSQFDKGHQQLTSYLLVKDWSFPHWVRKRWGYFLLPLLLNIVVEVLARDIHKEKKWINGISDWKGRSKTISLCRWHNLVYSKF